MMAPMSELRRPPGPVDLQAIDPTADVDVAVERRRLADEEPVA
jgi:hypothetical protein